MPELALSDIYVGKTMDIENELETEHSRFHIYLLFYQIKQN